MYLYVNTNDYIIFFYKKIIIMLLWLGRGIRRQRDATEWRMDAGRGIKFRPYSVLWMPTQRKVRNVARRLPRPPFHMQINARIYILQRLHDYS